MNKSSDSAIAQAFRELRSNTNSEQAIWLQRVEGRARELDATQPAVACSWCGGDTGATCHLCRHHEQPAAVVELPEAVACVVQHRDGAIERLEFLDGATIPVGRTLLYTADQLRAAVAGKDAEIAKLQALRKHHRARHKSYKRRCHDLEAAVAGYRRDAERYRVAKEQMRWQLHEDRAMTGDEVDAYYDALANLGSGDGKEGS